MFEQFPRFNGIFFPSKFPTKSQYVEIDRKAMSKSINPTDSSEVTKILREMSYKNNRGHDDTSNEVLKCCPHIIESCIAKAFIKRIEEET